MMIFLLTINQDENSRKAENEIIKALFIEYYDSLVKFCETIVCSKEESEDIVVAAFSLLIEKFDQEKKENVRGWLYSTVKFMAMNYKRKEKVRSETMVLISLDENSCGKESYIVDSFENVMTIIKQTFSEDEIKFIEKYFLIKNGQEKGKPLSDAEKSKKKRIRKKLAKALYENLDIKVCVKNGGKE